MRYIEIDEQQKNVPVFKNVIYALKITWKADKRLLLGYILQEGFFALYTEFTPDAGRRTPPGTGP